MSRSFSLFRRGERETPRDLGTSGLPLLDQATPRTRRKASPAAHDAATLAKASARSQVEQSHEEELLRLIPLAREVAERAGPEGCTVGDIRLVAQRRELIPQHPKGRELSYLTALPKRAGLVSTGRRRLSPIPRSRNDHVIWVLAKYSPPSAA